MSWTRENLRDDLRADLRDASEANWSDDELDRAIAQALGVYGASCPQQAELVAVNVTGRTIDLATALADDYAQLIRVVSAEYPTGQWPPTYCRFDSWAGVITLHTDTPLDAATVRLTYELAHVVDDDASTVPDTDRELLALGAAGYALRQLATATTDELHTGGPATVDRLHAAAALRLNAFADRLDARRRAVRTRQAYRPADPYLGRDIVRPPD